ncbi:MAG: response regulator [Dehalococcoidia bacterium]
MPMASAKIRVLLADDHAVLRAGLRALISAEPDMEVVGEANDGLEAVAGVEELAPDVVVMDISMPHLDGLEAARRIRERGQDTRLLFLTVHAEEQYLLQALKVGACGYVVKSSADTDLLEAIRAAYRGGVFLYPSTVRTLLGDYMREVEAGRANDSYERLTEREREVLKLTAEGYSNHEIADKLVLSAKTVDTYRQRIMDKLGLSHRSELVRYAVQRGLLRP